MMRATLAGLLLALSLTACGGQTVTPVPTPPASPQELLKENLLGTWFGKATYPDADPEKTTLKLMSSNDIVKGVVEVVGQDEETDEVTSADIGFINVRVEDDGKSVFMYAPFTPLSEFERVEEPLIYHYDGQVTENVFEGTVYAIIDGKEAKKGEFSFKKIPGSTTVRP